MCIGTIIHTTVRVLHSFFALLIEFHVVRMQTVGRDSSVGIDTRSRLDGPGIESQCGRDFPHPYRPGLGATQPTLHRVPGTIFATIIKIL